MDGPLLLDSLYLDTSGLANLTHPEEATPTAITTWSAVKERFR